MLRFLPGIIIVQAATIALVLAVINTASEGYWFVIVGIVLFMSVITAFWFNSIAAHANQSALARAHMKFAGQREKLRVKAEKEKSKVVKQSHEHVVNETRRVHAKANFKLGAVAIGALGAGALLIFSQFLTIGLLALSTAGGALGGYIVRVRQDSLARKKKSAQTGLTEGVHQAKLIEGGSHHMDSAG